MKKAGTLGLALAALAGAAFAQEGAVPKGVQHLDHVFLIMNNAIVLMWDENDYSTAPITNQVLLTVETNYGVHGRASTKFYTHFSLLKSLEAGFGLPCLNHACDSDVKVMSDLFGGGEDRGGEKEE